jgi:SAM-dependent methyltransferase
MEPTDSHFQPPATTFRDPEGRLYQDGDRILREIYPQSVDPVLAWIRSPLAQRWMEQGRMVATQVLPPADGKPVVLEHEPLFFPSYPWEWTLGQWMAAASLTLDLCQEALDSDFILKDATPLNILFSGPQAVFVDVLSFERRDPQSPLWSAYAQFVCTFLLPLSAFVHLGWPLAATLLRRDGYLPSDLAPYLRFLRRWRRPFLSLVTLPLLLEKRQTIAARRPRASEEASAFAVRHTLHSARRLLRMLVPSAHSSRWSRYTETASHYTPADAEGKQAFVRRSLELIRPAHLLDVGANTGFYSRIAAESGAQVVAWDSDVQAANLNWESARSGGLPILSLVADFARPTPAVGWRNRESLSLLDRARGRFDCVLMLGILHHLLVADQILLPAILHQLREISARWAIVEWIPKEDRQFDELCRGREQLYEHLTEEYFVEEISRRFAIRDHDLLPNGRSLWLVEALA